MSAVAQAYVTVTLTNNAAPPYNYAITNTFALTPPVTNFSSFNIGEFKTFLSNTLISVPLGYYSDLSKAYIPFANNAENTQGFLSTDLKQTHWPVHQWTLNVTNRVMYTLFDGPNATGSVLDFVNLGPFGSSTNIYQMASNNAPITFQSMWDSTYANDNPTASLMPLGITNQITYYINSDSSGEFLNSLNGSPQSTSEIQQNPFSTSANGANDTLEPYMIVDTPASWMACDPLVHYTVGDLKYPGYSSQTVPLNQTTFGSQIQNNNMGGVNPRYKFGTNNAYLLAENPPKGTMVFGDPGMFSPNSWNFPTNLFPSVGWLGRVHRGTPWQTVYLKSDDLNQHIAWGSNWVNSPYTYPTNDWSLLDLFTAVPNDNAARGLLSVNQANDPAWAAVFAGVVAINNVGNGYVINPTNDVTNIVDAVGGINAIRAAYPHGLFHHIGEILAATNLTVNSPIIQPYPATLNDEMVERIPQQTMGLLKVGLPQFVIYAWGQSLKPKNLYTSGTGGMQNLCTNYEITGEFLTRTVCHLVSDPYAASPKIVVDNYNIEPGN